MAQYLNGHLTGTTFKDTKPSDTKGVNSSLIISDLSKPTLDSVLLGFEWRWAFPPYLFFKSEQSDITCPGFLQ